MIWIDINQYRLKSLLLGTRTCWPVWIISPVWIIFFFVVAWHPQHLQQADTEYILYIYSPLITGVISYNPLTKWDEPPSIYIYIYIHTHHYFNFVHHVKISCNQITIPFRAFSGGEMPSSSIESSLRSAGRSSIKRSSRSSDDCDEKKWLQRATWWFNHHIP